MKTGQRISRAPIEKVSNGHSSFPLLGRAAVVNTNISSKQSK
jgi:hypothetical protein